MEYLWPWLVGAGLYAFCVYRWRRRLCKNRANFPEADPV